MRRGTLALMLLAVARAGAQTAIRRIAPDTFWNTLWRGHAVAARLKPGEVAFTRLLDARARHHMNVQRAQPSNPMVGPSM